MKAYIYLDNNASTPVHPAIAKCYQKNLSLFGNPSSLHQAGRKAKAAMETARENLAQHLHCQPEQLIFTSSGCESNSQILKSAMALPHIKTIFYDSTAHASIRYAVKKNQNNHINFHALKVNKHGHLQLKEVSEHFQKDSLLSCVWANNETGCIQDINQISEHCQKHDVLLHCDAVQALGKLSINLNKTKIDFLSLASHKVYAPKGCGALYAKNTNNLQALIYGPSHEQGYRAGTENVAGIIAFAEAVKLCESLDFSHIKYLKEKLLQGLKESCPNLMLFGDPTQSLDNTLCLAFPNVDGHHLAMRLDLEGIGVSTGSACSVGAIEPSPVLQAMGIAEDLNKSSIRISLGYFNQEKEIDQVLTILPKLIQELSQDNPCATT
eukprot:COSAG01_NODE_3_length_63519_cov_1591.007663_25_plen_381_part_00